MKDVEFFLFCKFQVMNADGAELRLPELHERLIPQEESPLRKINRGKLLELRFHFL